MPGGHGDQRRVDDELKAFYSVIERVDMLGQQVTIMFGEGHPIDAAYTDCSRALGAIGEAVGLRRHGQRADSMQPDIERAVEQLFGAHRRFLQAAHEAIGVR